jgi:hypothetical protein
MSLLILEGNINRYYRLPFERAYRTAKLKKHAFKEESVKALFAILICAFLQGVLNHKESCFD